MNEQKIILQSLVMDLKRTALNLHSGSRDVAEQFRGEALKWEKELEKYEHDEYLQGLLEKSKFSLYDRSEQAAEDLLMYSVLLQNYVLKLK